MDINSDLARDWVNTAESRNTDIRIMRAIAHYARDVAEAESVWQNSLPDATPIWEYATGNGLRDDSVMFWGDTSLSDIINRNAI